MEDKANITLKLDKKLLRAVKIVAAGKGTSISAYIAEKLTDAVKNEGSYEEAMRRALALMKENKAFGWRKPKSRDELYER